MENVAILLALPSANLVPSLDSMENVPALLTMCPMEPARMAASMECSGRRMVLPAPAMSNASLDSVWMDTAARTLARGCAGHVAELALWEPAPIPLCKELIPTAILDHTAMEQEAASE